MEYTIKQQNIFIRETSTGTGLQHINKNFFETCRIPLPPLLEQYRIVEKLNALFDKIENNRLRLEKIPILLNRFKQSVLIDAFKGNLTTDWRERNPSKTNPIKSFELIIKTRFDRKRTDFINENFINLDIPEEWLKTNIDGLSDVIVDCPHSTPKWALTGKICLRTTNLLPNRLNLSEVRYVSESIYNNRIERLKPQIGDILYSREGGILGIACILDIDEDVCLGQRMMMFRLNSNVNNRGCK